MASCHLCCLPSTGTSAIAATTKKMMEADKSQAAITAMNHADKSSPTCHSCTVASICAEAKFVIMLQTVCGMIMMRHGHGTPRNMSQVVP